MMSSDSSGLFADEDCLESEEIMETESTKKQDSIGTNPFVQSLGYLTSVPPPSGILSFGQVPNIQPYSPYTPIMDSIVAWESQVKLPKVNNSTGPSFVTQSPLPTVIL